MMDRFATYTIIRRLNRRKGRWYAIRVCAVYLPPGDESVSHLVYQDLRENQVLLNHCLTGWEWQSRECSLAITYVITKIYLLVEPDSTIIELCQPFWFRIHSRFNFTLQSILLCCEPRTDWKTLHTETVGKSNHPSRSLIGPGIRAPASYACRLFCEDRVVTLEYRK